MAALSTPGSPPVIGSIRPSARAGPGPRAPRPVASLSVRPPFAFLNPNYFFPVSQHLFSFLEIYVMIMIQQVSYLDFEFRPRMKSLELVTVNKFPSVSFVAVWFRARSRPSALIPCVSHRTSVKGTSAVSFPRSSLSVFFSAVFSLLGTCLTCTVLLYCDCWSDAMCFVLKVSVREGTSAPVCVVRDSTLKTQKQKRKGKDKQQYGLVG